MLWLDKFVNGVVSIVLSFIDNEELIFVNVYISYKSHFDISHHIMLGEIGSITPNYIHGERKSCEFTSVMCW